MKKYLFSAILIMLVLSMVGSSYAQQLSRGGHIKNVVSKPIGLAFELDNGTPTACSGTIGDWMIIPEANKSMIAVALMNFQSGQLIEAYTDGTFVEGFCKCTMFYVQGGN